MAGGRFPRGLRQTWELELLISGAVVFALLQLPSAVDELFDRLVPHFEGSLGQGLFVLYSYTGLALYVLIGSFLLHLMARAYWVGLVGLEAVFPEGVRWERTQYGPLARRLYQNEMPSLPTLITRVDDFCSMIFPFSFMLVFNFLVSILWAGLLGLAALVISRLALGGERFGDVFQGLVLVLLIPFVLLPIVDRALGHKLSPAGMPARLILGTNRFYQRALLMNLHAPINNVLFSNVPKKVIYPIFLASFLVTAGVFIGSLFVRLDIVSLDSDVYMPAEAGEHAVEPMYYEALRPAGEIFETVPSIQSDVIRDPYIKLFIPYYPRRHNPVIEKRCPGVSPLREGGFRFESPRGGGRSQGSPEAVLRCLAGIHRVSLDSRPLSGLPFHFYTHPRSGVHGIVAYIPAEGLARGGHLLRVEPVPRLELREGEVQRKPDLIRFWR